jgi:hypothetical protein
MKTKIAKALLRQRDPHQRRRLLVTYSVALLLLLLGHGYFSNLSSPLKLIPQTMTAIAMGYMILYIISLRQFKFVADFIDWTKVTETAEPSAGGNAAAPRASA